MPSERLEDTIRSVRVTTSAATDERIMAAIEAAMVKQNEQHPASVRTSGLIRRTIMNSKWTRLATAAAIVIAIMLGMYALTGSVDVTSITIAQVRQAMQEIDWMQIINKGGDENKTQGTEINWYSFTSKVEIFIDSEGRTRYSDFKTRRNLTWGPVDKDISESPIDETKEFAHGSTGPFEMMDKSLLQAAHGSNVAKELGTYQGQKVELWTAHNDVKNQPGYTRTLTVYIDVDRKLPIAATYDHNRPDGTVRRESDIEFKYPKTGPANIYEAGVPRSVQIKSSTQP